MSGKVGKCIKIWGLLGVLFLCGCGRQAGGKKGIEDAAADHEMTTKSDLSSAGKYDPYFAESREKKTDAGNAKPLNGSTPYTADFTPGHNAENEPVEQSEAREEAGSGPETAEEKIGEEEENIDAAERDTEEEEENIDPLDENADVPPPERTVRLNLEVDCILQNPELPTGCEVTSLAIVLQWMGFDVNKLTLAREYLPQNGVPGKDSPFDVFLGNPEKSRAYGCYPPVIVQTANAWFRAHGLLDEEPEIAAEPTLTEYYKESVPIEAVNYTGATLEELFQIMEEERTPVILWITAYLEEPHLNTTWRMEGENIDWLSPNHCVVLYGFNRKTRQVFVADPLVGNVLYDRTLFETRYEEMGEKAVVLIEQ